VPNIALQSQAAAIGSVAPIGIVVWIERSRGECSARVVLEQSSVPRLQDAKTSQRAVSDVREHAAISGWPEGNNALLGPGVRQSLPPVRYHPLRDDSEYPVIRYVRA
jgi:hypothetical protein